MTIKLHLLGGSGRIGRALVDSLVNHPLDDLSLIQIYCDSTKSAELQAHYIGSSYPQVKAACYSSFGAMESSSLHESDKASVQKNIVVNLRGINNKQQWLNQPLDSLELHARSCRSLVDADLWMQPGFEIIHLSSLLCELIEGPRSLDEICEGQESYRRPYMVSRLHQEMILSANAFQHSITTSFLRMPAVYGFSDDNLSPWVLNSLCKLKISGQSVEPRHPDHIVYLAHRDPLIEWVRAVISGGFTQAKKRTVNYLKPPMLRLPVSALALLVETTPNGLTAEQAESHQITLIADTLLPRFDIDVHLNLLSSTISELVSNA